MIFFKKTHYIFSLQNATHSLYGKFRKHYKVKSDAKIEPKQKQSADSKTVLDSGN